MQRHLILFLILGCTFLFLWGCPGDGGGGNWCPGTICYNCATDCPTPDCPSGQSPACVGGSYFDADPNLRCSFCVDD